VKWTGYPDYGATWEPLSNLANAAELVAEFDQAHPVG
jgi:Chromo (CHRromatin Organisation MOdifier) domain